MLKQEQPTLRILRPWEKVAPRTCSCKNGRHYDAAGQMTYCTCYEGIRERESDEEWARIQRENRERSLLNCFHDCDDEIRAYSWESYPPEGDQDALAQLRAFPATWDGKRGLIVTGPIGSGKTVGVSCLFKDLVPILTTHPRAIQLANWRARFAPMVRIIAELRSALNRRSGSEEMSFSEVLTDYSSAYLLCIDDVGVEKLTPFVAEQFYSIINDRIWRGLPTFMTTNLSIDGLREHLTPRVFSRLLPKVDIIEMTGPDLRELEAERHMGGA